MPIRNVCAIFVVRKSSGIVCNPARKAAICLEQDLSGFKDYRDFIFVCIMPSLSKPITIEPQRARRSHSGHGGGSARTSEWTKMPARCEKIPAQRREMPAH
ncbi:MAG: hypothetical protein OXH57_08750 [Ekhidna sp.]|nr:hypothetical protein [Ekhidna sp.]